MKESPNAIIPPKTLRHLEWASILRRFSEHCRGDASRARALSWELTADEVQVRARLQRVDEARSLLDQGASPPIGQPISISSHLLRASRGGVLDPEALRDVGLSLEASYRTKRFLKEFDESHLALSDITERLIDRQSLAQEILMAFDPSGELNNNASGELGQLRQRVDQLHSQLKDQVHTLLSEPSYEGMLQDEFFTIREDRYVLPIRSSHKRHVEGIVHGWSASGATVFIEPRVVVEANNRLKMAQGEVNQEIHRILTKLTRELAHIAQEIELSHEALIDLDLAFAAARLSKELRATSPIVTPEPILSLKGARHPLLSFAGVEVIPNLIELGGEGPRVLVITGPNAGGKTVVMKTAGLLVLMAMAGFHIPAEAGSIVPLTPGLFSDMGDEQDLHEGQSTFSGHIVNLRGILHQLRPNSLVLLDEIAIGTDPTQGSALAQALLEYFVDRESLVIVTTHFEALKLLPGDDPRFRNGAVEYDEVHSKPTYRLRYDIPGSSSALHMAKRLGMPSQLIERAQRLTGEQQQRLEKVIVQMEERISAARHAQRDAEREAQKLRVLNSSLSIKEKKLTERLKRGLEHERDQALKEARKTRERVRALRDRLQDREADVDELLDQEQTLNGEIEELNRAQMRDKLEASPLDLNLDQLSLGQRVWVISLDTHAELSRLPDNKGRCQVQAGLMSIQVDVHMLRAQKPETQKKRKTRDEPSPSKFPKNKPRPKQTLTWDDAPPQTPDNTCDVRGKRGEEAITALIPFLDALYGRGCASGFIIHGHGTGALKRHIRDWLPSCDYIHAQRPGAPREGGDGVTAVLITTEPL